MYLYTYLNNSKYPNIWTTVWPTKNKIRNNILFICRAVDILIADKLYEKKFGNNTLKQKYISCCIGDKLSLSI